MQELEQQLIGIVMGCWYRNQGTLFDATCVFYLLQPLLHFYIWRLPRYAQKYSWIILQCGLWEWIKWMEGTLLLWTCQCSASYEVLTFVMDSQYVT